MGLPATRPTAAAVLLLLAAFCAPAAAAQLRKRTYLAVDLLGCPPPPGMREATGAVGALTQAGRGGRAVGGRLVAVASVSGRISSDRARASVQFVLEGEELERVCDSRDHAAGLSVDVRWFERPAEAATSPGWQIASRSLVDLPLCGVSTDGSYSVTFTCDASPWSAIRGDALSVPRLIRSVGLWWIDSLESVWYAAVELWQFVSFGVLYALVVGASIFSG